MAMKPKLDADLSGEPVDQTDYRSKIGSLMYLTSSRPYIVQAVCYCARYQARTDLKTTQIDDDQYRLHGYYAEALLRNTFPSDKLVTGFKEARLYSMSSAKG
ncbi:hypothetical protein Tco_0975240 [Tanacetum coccineum]|uniref:Uncharacterized protein n=1 Tax=Tanacetum coccineum TaxID=301880 RepID=A0ABQ5EDV1_9ASTR